jgi:hypothetical protein
MYYMPNDRTPCNISYNMKKNIVYFDVPESAFVPKYLDYMLEYLGIPKNATKIFVSTEDPNESKQSN